MPEAWPAVRVFLAAETQWRIAPSGLFAGLDYRGAMAAARGGGENWRSVFEALKVMEGEILEAQDEKR